MFSQASVQPQIAAALAQLGNIVNSVRQGSTYAYPKSRYKSRAASRHSHPETSEAVANELTQPQKPDILQPAEVDIEECLTILTKEENLRQLSQLVEQVNESLESGEDQASFDSHVSADTFFENKTGFQEELLETSSYRQPFWPFLRTNGPKLLMSPEVTSAIQQSRGFLTSVGSGKGLGMNSKKDKKEETITKIELGEQFEKGKNTTINIHVKNDENETAWNKLARTWSFRILVVFFLAWAWKTFSAISGKLPGAGISNLTTNNFEVSPEMTNVTFKDVKGIDEVREELEDIVHYLKHPEKFQNFGAKLPKGVLLVGPPGVGKTLVAKAVAGEAGVPFFQASGSEFDEIFVGVGAKRVRNLFSAAKMRAPCIIFIDEIDAVASKRVNSPFSPHANQTINQLLAEMDGFSAKDGVIVVAATNRRDHLDKAMLRPGRFDSEVVVAPPDIKGRKDIFKLYLDKVKCVAGIDIDRLGKLTFGFTGADIQNIVNQAALNAVKENKEAVCMDNLLFALDKHVMGPARKSLQVDKEDKWATAVHESGHTLVSFYTKNALPFNKVTILARGRSLGHMQSMLNKDIGHSTTKAELLARIDVAMGGRIAEEIVMGPDQVSEGCSSDLKMATGLAESIVSEMGMADKLGPRVYRDQDKNISQEQRALQDVEINKILKESYERAKKILEVHKDEHKRLVDALLKYETIDKTELADVLKGRPIRQKTS